MKLRVENSDVQIFKRPDSTRSNCGGRMNAEIRTVFQIRLIASGRIRVKITQKKRAQHGYIAREPGGNFAVFRKRKDALNWLLTQMKIHPWLECGIKPLPSASGANTELALRLFGLGKERR